MSSQPARAALLADRRFTLIGITDEVCVCDLCGKEALKCTMLLCERDADGNEIGEVYFGRDCGAAALRWPVSADRAEKLVKGTARLSNDDQHRIWNAWRLSHDGRPTGPAKTSIGGVDVEIWDVFYGPFPTPGTWTPVQKGVKLCWRVAP